MVLGIVSLFLGILASVPAIILSAIGIGRANEVGHGKGQAITGLVTGIVGIFSTIVLAAVVFVLISNLSDAGDDPGAIGDAEAPDVQLSKDESGDRLNVLSAPQGVRWSEFQVHASRDIGIGVAGPPSGADDRWDLPDRPLTAGGYLALCSSGGSATDVEVSLYHRSSATVVKTYTFATLAAC